VPLTLVLEFVAGAVVAGAVVAAAVAAGATSFVPELLVATGLALFVAAAVALVVALALEDVEEDDDEADALDVAPGPVTGPPAILIALVVPN
jgi:membrane protein implicated in regulation of membrane protease activity